MAAQCGWRRTPPASNLASADIVSGDARRRSTPAPSDLRGGAAPRCMAALNAATPGSAVKGIYESPLAAVGALRSGPSLSEPTRVTSNAAICKRRLRDGQHISSRLGRSYQNNFQ